MQCPRLMKHLLIRVVPLAVTLLMLACGGDGGGAGGAAPAPATPTAPSVVPPSGPTSASCTAVVASPPASVPGAGGQYTLPITIGAGCAWTTRSDASWASVSPASGQGSGAAVLTVEDNPDAGNSRSANLTIAGQVLHFSQANGCTFTINRTAADVVSDSSRVEIVLTTLAACPWTTSSSETWLRVQPARGTGSETVIIEVSANSGDTRHAFATIAGRRVQITQSGR